MPSNDDQARTPMTTKPRLSFWQIWNMCFGFMGIQFGFALQNSNVSRIFQTLGASVDDIPVLWIAAPLTGLLVQPIVGQRIMPRGYHPLVDELGVPELDEFVVGVKSLINRCVAAMPAHAEFIARNCAAAKV
jgi:hypothetical protein